MTQLITELSEILEKAVRQAREAASSVDFFNIDKKARALTSIAEFTSEPSDFEAARSPAAAIGSPYYSSLACVNLARVSQEKIDFDAAYNFACKRDNSDHSKSINLLNLTKALADAGLLELAQKTANIIPDSCYKSSAFVAIARVSHDKQDLENARAAANCSSDHDSKSGAFLNIAKYSKDIQDFKRASEEANKMNDPFWCSRNLSAIAESAVKYDVGEAREIAEKIPDFDMKADTFIAIGSYSNDIQDFKKARKIAADIPSSRWKAVRIACLGVAVTKHHLDFDRTEVARITARKIRDSQFRFKAILSIANYTKEATDLEDARNCASILKFDLWRCNAFIKIGDISREAQDFQQALVNRYIDNARWPQSLVEITQGMLFSGSLAFAREVVEEIRDDYCIAEALTHIAEYTSDPKDFEQALQAAKKIYYPDERCYALIGVSKAVEKILEKINV